MGIIGKTTDFEQVVSSLDTPPVIANHLDISYPEDKEKFDRLLFTHYKGPTFSMEPRCDCGVTHGGDKRGKVCHICRTTCLPHTEKKIQSELVLECPEGVHAFMSPFVYSVLSSAYKLKNSTNLIRYFIDKNYSVRYNPILDEIEEAGFKRGLNYFYEHFDEIMEFLQTNRNIPKSDIRKEIPLFIEAVRDKMWTKFLPIPNKMTFVTESSATGKFADMENIGAGINAINAIMSLKTRIDPPSFIVRENTAVKVIVGLSEFYEKQVANVHGQKPGMWRKLVFGTRMPFTGRAVITSLTGAHDYDEVHQPWGLFIVMYQFHIENKLYRRGFSVNEAKGFIARSIQNYHPLMREIIDELIDESPYMTHTGKKGLPILLNRNPSLKISSIIRLYITTVKDEVMDKSISFSVLVLAGMNADFDGDQLNEFAILDYFQYQQLSRLSITSSTLDVNSPNRVDGTIKIPKELTSCIGNWLEYAPKTLRK